MSFKKNKYTVIRQAISKDLASFIANYFSMQKQVYDTCRQARYFSPFETILGYYEGKNEQIPDTYSQYSNMLWKHYYLNVSLVWKKQQD